MRLSGAAIWRPLMINSVSRRGHHQVLLATFSRPKIVFPQLMSPFQATRRRNLGLAEANFKGYGHPPLLAVCDNTGGEPLAWMLRRGSAGSNTAADHIALADAAIAALPPAFRRRLMVTVDGA